MKSSDVRFKALSVRRRIVPGHQGIVSYNMFVLAEDLPDDFPDENVRSTDDFRSKKVYKDVANTLLNRDELASNMFVFNNLGVRVIADEFHLDEATGMVTLKNARVPNGAHTITIIKDRKAELVEENKDSVADEGKPKHVQCVDLRVDVGIPPNWETTIVQANNTIVEVKKSALAEHENKFQWLKDCLPDSYVQKIDFRDEGREGTELSIRDVICLLSFFNVDSYSPESKTQPLRGYSSPGSVLEEYLRDFQPERVNGSVVPRDPLTTSWARLAPIAKDILFLRDLISWSAVQRYDSGGQRVGKKLSFVIHTARQQKTRTGRQARPMPDLQFPFLGKTGTTGLMRGAHYPILASFRALVRKAQDGQYEWAVPFEKVKEIWHFKGGDLVEIVKDFSRGGQIGADSLGKDSNVWGRLYSEMRTTYLERALEARDFATTR